MKIAEFKAKEVSDYFFDIPKKRNDDAQKEKQRGIDVFNKMTRGKK